MKICKECGKEVLDEAVFCPNCGIKFNLNYCPNCGKQAKDDHNFCGYCGTSLKKMTLSQDIIAETHNVNSSYISATSTKEYSSKKTSTLFVIIVICLITMFPTVPDERKHKDALLEKITVVAQNDVDKNAQFGVKKFIEILGGLYLDKNYTIDNYCLFSLGKLKTNNEEKIVSFGIWGYVITPPESSIKLEIDKIKQDIANKMNKAFNY